MTQEEKSKVQKAYEKKIYSKCKRCYIGSIEVVDEFTASGIYKGQKLILFACTYCGLISEHIADKLLDKKPENNSEDTLNEELVAILKSEIVILASPCIPRVISSRSLDAFVDHLCIELNIKSIYDLPRSRFWEAMLLIKKGRI